jgi:ComF family protein
MLELLWPSTCHGCGSEGDGPLCPRCTPGRVHRPGFAISGIDGLITSSGYESGVGRALRVAKYGKRRDLAVRLAHRFAEAVAPAILPRPDVIVPVPSPRSALLRRGFSTTALLAHALAASLNLPVVHALIATPGPRQAGLSPRGRTRNARSRIRFLDPQLSRVDGRTVLLIDDVVTTGATAAACAQELLGSGAKKVVLATLCVTRDARAEMVTSRDKDFPPPCV